MKKIIKKIKEVWRSIFVGAKELDDLIESIGTNTNKDLTESEYEDEYYKFVWGVKSGDDVTAGQPSLYTMNDIDILFRKQDGKYILDVETAYWFDNKDDEIKYLEHLLSEFTDFMTKNGYDTNEMFILWMSEPKTITCAKTLPELYTNFKIFVEGFKVTHENRKE